MPAIPKHSTAVAEGEWDAGANVGRISNDAGAATLRKEYAWVDPDKDSATKSAYKFPHHFVSESGEPGAASLNGVRNALARLADSKIPEGDKAGVKAHLEAHLAAADKSFAGLVTRALDVRAINLTMRTCDFIASTDAVDSYDEIVEQDWDLARYQSNPVVLYAHDSRELPIGTCTRCEVVRGALECTIQFCTEDMNPVAERVWKMVQSKVLRAVSVGFVPKTVRLEKRDGRELYVLSQCVLHEISVVPIPANHEALAKMKAAARSAPVTNHPDDEESPATETNMSETNETKALLAARETEIVTLKSTITTAEAKAKAAEDKAASLETKLSESSEKLAAETKAKGEIEAKAIKAEADRDAATARVAELEAAATERHVESLVGVKFAPAVKDAMLSLAKKDRGMFDQVMAATPDMKILGQIVPSEKGTPAPVTGAGNGTDLAALMNEDAAAE